MATLAGWPAAVRGSIRWLRFTPFDQATADGRASERHRRAALSALAAALSKGMALVATLISIPLALHYLGAERFGVWSTVSSLVIALQFADFGIGNGVINAVAKAHAKGDEAAVRQFVSSAAFALSTLGCIALLLLLGANQVIPWPSIFKVNSAQAIAEIGPAMGVFAACVALAIPLGLVQRVQIGLQEGFLGSLWQCVANLLSVIAIWVSTRLELGLPWLVLALLGAPLAAAFMNSLVFFIGSGRAIRPMRRAVTAPATKALLHTGAGFLVLQIAGAVVFNSDSIVIAMTLGAAAVTEYAIADKLFGAVTAILSTAVSPLWPAYGDAASRGDIDWIERTLTRSLLAAAAVATALSLALLALSRILIEVWIGGAVVVSGSLLVVFALWKPLEGAGMAVAIFLNGAGIIRFQIVTACLMAAGALLLKPWLVALWGPVGAPAVTVLLFTCVNLVPMAFYIPGVLRNMRAIRSH